MDMQIAERLQKLRKKNGYSQEQLADELNVSRQAVSKWECGAALPDTENLIALSRIYNCSVDEILFDQASTENLTVEVDSPQEVKQPALQNRMMGIVSVITVFLSIIIYTLCGSLLDLWHPAWIVFLAIPIVPSLAESIAKRDPYIFCFPVLVVAVYLIIGFVWSWWHPGWALFLLIPVYYVVVDSLRSKPRK